MNICVLLMLLASFRHDGGDHSLSDCVTINKITLTRIDVFGDLEQNNAYHRMFQAMHATTREYVIQKALLFKVGDCMDSEMITETERNLRSLNLFSDAYIVQHTDATNGTVHLEVTTIDRFTLRVNFGVSRKGGINKVRASLGESNLMGHNINLNYTYESRSDDTEFNRLFLRTPRFLKHYQAEVQYSRNDEGLYRRLTLERPFWALNDGFSYGVEAYWDHTASDYYLDDAEEIEIPNQVDVVHGYWYRELGDRNFSKRLGVSLGFQDLAYGEAPAFIRVPEHTRILPLGLSYTLQRRHDFVERRGVDSLIHREDIVLSSSLSVGGGLQARERSSEEQVHSSLWFSMDHVGTPNERQLMAWRLSGSQRMYGGERMESKLHGFYHHYVFFGKAQALVVGGVVDYRDTTDDLYLPLTLGEDLGLRGYDAFHFTGNKRALFNFEHRLTYPWRTASIALGQVLFLDSGATWKRGEAMDTGSLHWSAGWGLRLDMPALFGNKVLRLDVAFPLDGESPLFSFSTGHIFGHRTVNRGFDKDF